MMLLTNCDTVGFFYTTTRNLYNNPFRTKIFKQMEQFYNAFKNIVDKVNKDLVLSPF